MKKWTKVLIAVFFFVWERFIYSKLVELTERTETLLDDHALDAVDQALDILKNELDD
jgi:hypothetical protein